MPFHCRKDTILFLDILGVLRCLFSAVRHNTTNGGQRHPSAWRFFVPSFWMSRFFLAVFWATIANYFCRVLPTCPGLRPKGGKPLRGRLGTPGIVIPRRCQHPSTEFAPCLRPHFFPPPCPVRLSPLRPPGHHVPRCRQVFRQAAYGCPSRHREYFC